MSVFVDVGRAERHCHRGVLVRDQQQWHGGGGGPAPTRFSLSSAGGTLTPGASPSPALQIMRSGDTNGQYTVGYSVAGASCASPGTYQLTFTSGGTGSQTITQAAANSTAGTCTVTLGNSTLPDGSSGNVNTGITAAVFQVSTSGGGGGNPPPTGCPAAPAGMAIETFGLQYAHNYWMTQANGMMAATMPATTKSVPTLSYVPSPRTNTPATGYVRFSISKCPGQISEDYTDRCNRHSFVSFTSLRWVNVASGTLTSKEAANAAGLCWAPASEGPWYLNIRHEFAEGCNYGASMCGVLWAWQ